jgi:hypothetical protein
MSLREKIELIDKGYAWSFFGFILAIPSIAVAIYALMLEEEPLLSFEILGNEPVLDVKEKLQDLDVLYQGQDISSRGRSLSVILVRIVNRGNANLLINDYDEKAPVTIILQDGDLVRASVSESSNPYLQEVIELGKTENKIIIPPVIIESEEWFVVKILTLHDIVKRPLVISSGKIAGQGSITVTDSNPIEVSRGFWRETFQGSALTQLVRLLSYMFAFFCLVILIIAPIISAQNFLLRRERKKVINSFKRHTEIEVSNRDEFVFEAYLRGGKSRLEYLFENQDIDSVLNRIDYMNNKMERGTEGIEAENEHNASMYIDRELEYHDIRHPIGTSDFDKLKKDGYLEKHDGKWVYPSERYEVATKFLEYVRIKEAK